jgi:peroxiredoxin
MEPVIRVGEPAPDFELPDLDGHRHRLASQRGRLTVLHFWSAVCPWTERTDERVLAAIRAAEADLWSIAANADESLDVLRRVAQERGLGLVLVDPRQYVADLYAAAATPHVFLIDGEGILSYHGAPDDARFRDPRPRRSYLAEALHAVRAGRSPNPAVTMTYGCAIVRAAEV